MKAVLKITKEMAKVILFKFCYFALFPSYSYQGIFKSVEEGTVREGNLFENGIKLFILVFLILINWFY